MKNFLFIILISVSTSSFSQVEIDTSEIKSIRYEWNIDPKTKDTTLFTTITEYKSGFFYDKLEFSNDSSKFGHFYLSKGDYYSEVKQNGNTKNYISGMGDGILKTYYDKYQNPDSIVLTIYKPEFKKISTLIEKHYKSKGKLDFITDLNGKNFYKYNLFGKLKRIEQFRDSVLHKISDYKNGLLISETFPTREKYRKKFTYDYNKEGRMILKDADDYYFLKYYYNNFGIEKIEKIYKKNNSVVEYTLFEYDKEGKLIWKKEFYGKDILREEFFYEYK